MGQQGLPQGWRMAIRGEEKSVHHLQLLWHIDYVRLLLWLDPHSPLNWDLMYYQLPSLLHCLLHKLPWSLLSPIWSLSRCVVEIDPITLYWYPEMKKTDSSSSWRNRNRIISPHLHSSFVSTMIPSRRVVAPNISSYASPSWIDNTDCSQIENMFIDSEP